MCYLKTYYLLIPFVKFYESFLQIPLLRQMIADEYRICPIFCSEQPILVNVETALFSSIFSIIKGTSSDRPNNCLMRALLLYP